MRVVFRVYTFIVGVLVFTMLPFVVFAAETASPSAGSTVLRILQIIWIASSLVSLGVMIYGFLQMRRVREELFEFERSKRLVFIGGIVLVISLLLFGIITFFISRGTNKSPVVQTIKKDIQIEAGFGSSLGPSSKISQHYPLRDQRDVSRNVPILITFSEEVNIASIDAGKGVLKQDTINIQALRADDVPLGDILSAHVVGADDKKTLKIIPDQLLGFEDEPSTKYRVTISSAVQNGQHTSMLGGTGTYSWVFYVGTNIDTAPPYVVSVFPVSGKDPAPRNSLVQMTFSKAIDPTNLRSAFVQLTDTSSGKPLTGSVSIHNNYRTLLFTSDQMCGSNECSERIFCLPGNGRIAIRIKSASIPTPRDAASPNLAASPPDGVVDIQGNSLDGGGEGGLKKDGISQGTKEDDYTWAFVTSNVMNTTMPTILSVLPGRNGSRVDLSAPVEIRFSKIMDMSSINQSTVVLDKGLQYWIESDLELDKKQTLSKVFHDAFKEDTTYSPEIHGKVRDIYQNCFASCAGPLQ